MCVLYPKCPNIAWLLTTLCYFQLGYCWQLQIKLHFRRRKNLLQFFPLFKLSLGFRLSLTSRLIKLPRSDWFRFIWTHTDHLSLWKCHINSPPNINLLQTHKNTGWKSRRFNTLLDLMIYRTNVTNIWA